LKERWEIERITGFVGRHT